MMYQIISKDEALSINQTWYFTGLKCKNGHIDKRYVNTNICYECKRQAIRRDYKKHSDRINECNKKSYNKTSKILHNKRCREWSNKNKKKNLEIKKKYRENNRDKIRIYGKGYMKRKRLDPFYRLSRNLSKAIWENLKSVEVNKDKLSFSKFVSWTMEELIKHLEAKFEEDMSWENYGKFWHLDHIKPLSWFNLETEFQDAWDINNLQPMKSFENLSKNNRYEGKYKQNTIL